MNSARTVNIAVAYLEHAHIYGQTEGILAAGGNLLTVYDPDPAKIAQFAAVFPGVKIARSEQEILEDERVVLVVAAGVPCERGPFGCRVMEHGKDYFVDKAPFTTLAQLEQARRVVAKTGRRYHVYFSERMGEASFEAHRLITAGAIGRVVNIIGLGPHRLNAPIRADWFFDRQRYGGLICDIGSHQTDQFLWLSGNTEAKVLSSAVGNFAHPQFPQFDDFGEFTLLGANGCTGYHRVDWLTPEGLGTFGDGRKIILGSEGYLELRSCVDIAQEQTGEHLYIVDGKEQRHLRLAGSEMSPFFPQLVNDICDRTQTAMTQDHVFAASELSLIAQASAIRVGNPRSQPALA
jgi:predicted dehydrogenase